MYKVQREIAQKWAIFCFLREKITEKTHFFAKKLADVGKKLYLCSGFW